MIPYRPEENNGIGQWKAFNAPWGSGFATQRVVLSGQHRAQGPPAQQVQVDVVNFLTPVGIAVHDEPIAIFGNPFFFCDPGCNGKDSAQERFVLGRDVVGCGNGLVWNDEDVRRRLGMDVSKGRDKIVLKDDLSRDFSSNDFAENGFFWHGIPLLVECVRSVFTIT